MKAYTADYRTYGFSETLKKLNCLNLTKQQEREYKAQQKTFHIPFDTSMFAETEKNFFQMFNFEHTKLTKYRLNYLHNSYYNMNTASKFDVGRFKFEANLPLKATKLFKKQRTNRIPLQLQKKYSAYLTY